MRGKGTADPDLRLEEARGLALAIGLGACLNAFLLLRKLRQYGFYQPQPGWGVFTTKVGMALVAMGGVLQLAMGPEQWWLSSPATLRVGALCGMVVLGVAVYFLVLGLLGFRVRDFHRRAA